MTKTMRRWSVRPRWRLPSSVMDFVPPAQVMRCVRDTVREQLELS